MDLRLLGNVAIQSDDRIIVLDRAAERCVLATFALQPARPVDIGTLIDHVWDGRPPAKAERTIAGYVRAVRRVIEEAGGHRDWLVNRRPRAYELRIDRSSVDYHRFVDLVVDAKASAHQGDHGQAVIGYQRALDLWRGDPLCDLTGGWADRYRETLRQEHLTALCALLELQLRVGDHAAVADRATRLVNEIVPTDRLIGLAMYGLAYSGRRAMIPEFLDRAARRMWETVEVRPDTEIEALARRLVAEPTAVEGYATIIPFSPASHSSWPTADESCVDGDPGSSASGGSGQRDSARIIMTATGNGNIYQAAGNQYITGA